jgi:hypothetical protein
MGTELYFRTKEKLSDQRWENLRLLMTLFLAQVRFSFQGINMQDSREVVFSKKGGTRKSDSTFFE